MTGPGGGMIGQDEDQRLLAALAGGDLEALTGLYDAHSRRVYHVLLANGVGETDAEDLLQEVFLTLLDRGRGVKRIANLPAYLFAVARYMAGRYRKGRKLNSPITEAERAQTPGPEEAIDQIATVQALRRLPAEQAEVIVLKVWHNLTFAKIAESLGIPPDTAASRYRYGIEKLRVMWGDIEDESKSTEKAE